MTRRARRRMAEPVRKESIAQGFLQDLKLIIGKDMIPPGFFGAIHGLVCRAQDRFTRFTIDWVAGNPHRNRDRQGAESIWYAQRIKRLAYVLGALISSVYIDIGHDDHKFLAAITAGKVTAPAVLRQSNGECLQDFIAGLVTVGIIDPFEVVEVDHDDTNGIIFAGRAGKLTLEGFFKITPVEQVRQGI